MHIKEVKVCAVNLSISLFFNQTASANHKESPYELPAHKEEDLYVQLDRIRVTRIKESEIQ